MSSIEVPKAGYYVTFIGDDRYLGKYYRVIAVEAFQYQTGNTSGTAEFSTVASGSTTGFKDIKAIQPGDTPLKFVYAEWGLKDGMEYQMKLQAGSIRLGPDNDLNVGIVTNEISPYYEPDPSFGMWLVDDWFPSIQAENVTPFTQTPQVWFKGLKFQIEEVTDQTKIQTIVQAQRYMVITLGGVGNQTRAGGLLRG